MFFTCAIELKNEASVNLIMYNLKFGKNIYLPCTFSISTRPCKVKKISVNDPAIVLFFSNLSRYISSLTYLKNSPDQSIRDSKTTSMTETLHGNKLFNYYKLQG